MKISAPTVVKASIADIKILAIAVDVSITWLTETMKATAGFVFTYSNKGGVMVYTMNFQFVAELLVTLLFGVGSISILIILMFIIRRG